MFSALLLLCVFPLLPLCLSIPEPYLLFSTWFTVSRMNLDGSEYTVLVDSSSNVGIQAVDYHQRQNTMYWGHYRDNTISRANLDGSNPEVIVSNVNRPSGLAVDWINDKVYFSFGDPGSNEVNPNHLATYDITTGEYTEISPATLYQVYYELAIEEKLYWTSGSRVLQSTLNGETVQTLLATGSCINSLTLNGNLYFLHGCSSPKSVRSLNLTTLEVSIIVENVDGMFGVAAYEDTVFWTGIARVYSTIIDGSVISELLHIPSYGGSSFRGITVVHPSFQVTNISCQSVTTTATVGFTSASPVVSQTHIAKPSPSLMVQEVAQSSISSAFSFTSASPVVSQTHIAKPSPSLMVQEVAQSSISSAFSFTSASPVVSQTHIAKPSPSLMVQEVAQSSISSAFIAGMAVVAVVFIIAASMLMIFGGIFCYCKKNPNGQKTKIPDRSHPEETRTSHITTLENFDTMQENMAYDTENVVYDDTLLDSTTNTQPITPATNEVQSTIYESIDEACIDDTDMEQVELPKHSITTKT